MSDFSEPIMKMIRANLFGIQAEMDVNLHVVHSIGHHLRELDHAFLAVLHGTNDRDAQAGLNLFETLDLGHQHVLKWASRTPTLMQTGIAQL